MQSDHSDYSILTMSTRKEPLTYMYSNKYVCETQNAVDFGNSATSRHRRETQEQYSYIWGNYSEDKIPH